MDPLDSSQTAAHFYRFAQIVMGQTIVVSGGSYDFSGTPLTFDATQIFNMFPDPTLAKMEKLLSPADFQTCQAFSAAFTDLLDLLNTTFNGSPGLIDNAIDTNMFDLVKLASSVLAIQIAGTDQNAGLCFELFSPNSAERQSRRRTMRLAMQPSEP